MDFQLIKTELINLKNRLDDLTRRFERQAVKEAGAGGGGGSTTVAAPVTNTGTGTNPILGLAITPAAPGGAVALQGATPGTVQTGNLNLSGKVKAALVEATQFLIAGVPFLDSGTTFPASPVIAQRFYRTDRKIEYAWDGARWLSTQAHSLVLSIRNGVDFAQATTSVGAVFPREHTLNGIFLTAFEVCFTPRVVQSSTVFYTLTGAYIYPSNTPSNVTFAFPGVTDTKLFTVIGTNYAMPQDYTTPITIPAGVFRLGLVLTPTGAAGAFLFEATASYRLIG